MKRGRALLILFLLASVAGTAGLVPLGSTLALDGLMDALPQSKPMVEPLVVSGSLVADEVRIASELGGRIVGMHASEGDAVFGGQILASTDDEPLRRALREAESGVMTVRAQADHDTRQATDAEIASAEARVRMAEAGLASARRELAAAQRALDDPQDLDMRIIQARTDVALAAQGVESAEADLTQQKILRDRHAQGASDRMVAAAQDRLAAATEDQRTVTRALAHLEAMRANPVDLLAAVHAAESQLRVAEAQVAVARAMLADVTAPTGHERTALANAQVTLAKAQADVVRQQLDATVLRSPIEGTVMEIVLAPGEVAAPGATILTVASLDRLILRAYVPEGQVGRTSVGALVEVRVAGWPDTIFQGEVLRIGDEPEFTPRNVATREERLNTFYVVEIEVPSAGGLLKPGMSADAAFSG